MSKKTTKPRGTASGTDPHETSDSILAQELARLEEKRSRIREENQSYVDSHPELKQLLDDFVAAVITTKPHDIVNFGASFFKSMKSGGIGPAPLVIAGPSGVGKGTIIGILMKKFPELFGFSVSHTTRAPRAGEDNGVHYFFTAKEDMEAAIARGEFLEFANVHTNIYGTSFKAVDSVRSKGKICILDIDVQGVRNVQKSGMDCKFLFINPPSIEELESRLRGRGTESEEKIQVRLRNAQDEIAYGNAPGNFDFIVVNNTLDGTVNEIVSKLESWYPDLDFENAAAVTDEAK